MFDYQSTQRANNISEPILTKTIPKLPFEIVATDIFKCGKYEYLLIVDGYSGFFILRSYDKISRKRSHYKSLLFRRFVGEWNIQHVTSSPLYAQSNGLTER